MESNVCQISLDTLIGISTMLGHPLEDRSLIRAAQDPSLAEVAQACSTIPLSNKRQQNLFAIAPLDILVSEHKGQTQFHLLEINGTGIGGFTNLPSDVIEPVLQGLGEFALSVSEPDPLILIAISGKENDSAPRLNKLMHEKVLYVEAIKRSFESAGREIMISAMPHVQRDPACLQTMKPAVILGYIKDFVDQLTMDKKGRLHLFGRPVAAVINDRFILNVVEKFHHEVDLSRLATMNRCFLAGGDKGVAYSLFNDFLMTYPQRFFPRRVPSERIHSREELISTVLAWVRSGIRTVIKPQGTGLGHGIEFFLRPDEPEEKIIARIDRSANLIKEYYHLPSGGFPYTVCEYVDSCTIRRCDHPLHGHKFELRVVVYRDGMTLKAYPSIAKIASQVFDPADPAYFSLINNITTSAQVTCKNGTEHMLPLANRQTLELLGLRTEHLVELCSASTAFIRSVLDAIQSHPERFGLPNADRYDAIERPRLQLVAA